MDIICKRCGRLLPESEFYRTSKGAFDSTCKDCRKKAVKARYDVNRQNPEYMEKERVRGRDKYHRLYSGKRTDLKLQKQTLYPKLRSARRDFHVKLPRSIELHHWNYNDMDSVFVLEKCLHRRLHKSITLNMDEGIYYKGTEKLDTISKHYSVVLEVCGQYGYDASKVKVLRK